MPREKGFWFPAKAWGFGWGLPITWQGWAVLIVWGALLIGGVYLLIQHHQHALVRVAYVLAMIVVLTLICYATGEPPGWRWGGRSNNRWRGP